MLLGRVFTYRLQQFGWWQYKDPTKARAGQTGRPNNQARNTVFVGIKTLGAKDVADKSRPLVLCSFVLRVGNAGPLALLAL